MKIMFLTLLLSSSLMAQIKPSTQALAGRTVSQTQIQKCQKFVINTEKNDRKIDWQLRDGNKEEIKWALIKNKDTNLLYAKEKVKESKGVVYLADIPKNKTGYKLIIIETSPEESNKLSEEIKGCALKGDCSLKAKLSGCILGEKDL